MNAKTRKVIEDLLNGLKMCRVPGTYDEAVKAGEKLLNPPVKFVWYRPHIGPNAGKYVADIAGIKYKIAREQGVTNAPPRWVPRATKHGGVEFWLLPCSGKTLADAKQACVDYGISTAVANRECTKAAQIHTAPHIRKALTP